MIPDLTTERIDRLREAFLAAGYDADGVVELLGPQAHNALSRGEPEPAARASKGGDARGTLIRLFLLGETTGRNEADSALKPLGVSGALAAGVLAEDGDAVRAALDIRPHAATDSSWWVISDLDGELRTSSMPVHAEHVLGVGHASLSLIRATSRRSVGSLLDLGTGCGVQALHGSTHARHVTATDVSARALALARATFRLNRIEVETLEGEWFDPVAGRRFDQVVCNPPFVVGPPRSEFVYRDSGLSGDGASARVVGGVPALLNEGGTGQVLASWLHRDGQDWQERVTSWLPDGVDAWFVQRDVADPALYVGTWLRDAGYDPRSREGRDKAAEWLDWFEDNDVEGVGFGFVTLRSSGNARGEVVCEDLRHAFDDPLGPESDAWLHRLDWLREHESADQLLDARLVTAPAMVLEQVSSLGTDGWEAFVHRLHRTDGPGWQHELDEGGVRLIAGCQGALPVGELIGLLAAAYGADTDELARTAEPIVRDLVRHGMLLPAEWGATR